MTQRRETDRKTSEGGLGDGERIAKYLARAGVASRREAERIIEAGEVRVNGEVLTSPAFKVTGREKIEVAGQRVRAPESSRLFRYHKPAGLITTNDDPAGRRTIFDELPKSLPRLVTVGRLDLTTEGLLLLTNDGELARILELPSSGLERTYRVRAHGVVTPDKLAKLARGITVDGVSYQPIRAALDRETGTNAWLIVTLTEGKKREVRRALESVGLIVNRLIRIKYGPFELGQLKPGQVEEILPAEFAAFCGESKTGVRMRAASKSELGERRAQGKDTSKRRRPKPPARRRK
jgi:23S rRNA pseudouridine2605 synthase